MVQAAGVQVLFASLTGDVLLDMLVAALMTILCYSSLAVVLLMASLASLHVIALPVALGLVLGANLGSGLLGMLSTLKSPPEARRVTLGNFLFKLIGCILLVPFIRHVEGPISGLGIGPAQEVVLFHLAFNVTLALIFIFFTASIARIAERLLPTQPAIDDPGKPRHLDPSALATPTLAISCAAREALRIGDVIEQMLNGLLTVLKTNDRALAERLRKMDDVVDDLYTAVKLYLTQISREALEEAEGRRWADIVSFTINMEQVGDIIERIIIELEEKKIDKGRNFSEAGMAEICDLHARLIANLRLGLSVFLNGDLKSAQELLAQKVLFRDLERAYADSHLARLAENTLDSIETSSLHLDLISDLKRINSHISSMAYPILEQAGVLAKTRLKEPEVVRARSVRRPPRSRVAAPEGAQVPSGGHALMPATDLTLGVTLAVLGAGLLHAGWNALLKSAPGRRPAARHRDGGRGLRRVGTRGDPVRRLSRFRRVDVHAPVRGHPLGVLRHARARLSDGRSVVRLPADARHGAAHRHAAERALPARMADPAGRARHRADLHRYRGHRVRRPQSASAGRRAIRARQCCDHRRLYVGRRRGRARGGQAPRVTRCGSRSSRPSRFSAGSGGNAAARPSPTSRAAGGADLIGGAASLGAYAIVLWAMTRAPIAAVAALRETSVLFAALIGAIWLKEGFGWPRLAGAASVVAGVAALKLDDV